MAEIREWSDEDLTAFIKKLGEESKIIWMDCPKTENKINMVNKCPPCSFFEDFYQVKNMESKKASRQILSKCCHPILRKGSVVEME